MLLPLLVNTNTFYKIIYELIKTSSVYKKKNLSQGCLFVIKYLWVLNFSTYVCIFKKLPNQPHT